MKEENGKIHVAVCVVTFNQKNYIAQALDSILRQKAAFPVDIIVGDDCSTDGTMGILENYAHRHANIIVLTSPVNRGVVKNTVSVFRYIFAHEDYKYIAMLDGDDWWSDEHKLQMQVDFMEAHTGYSFVYTRCGVYSEQQKRLHHSFPANTNGGGDLFPILMKLGIPNCTMVHRTEMLKTIDWDELIEQNLFSCDYATNVMMAAQGYVGFIDKETAIWRRTGATVSSPTDIEKQLTYCEHEIRQGVYLGKKFPNTPYAAFTEQEQERHRQHRRYDLAIGKKDYALLCTVDWQYLDKGKPWYAANKVAFFTYCYLIKKAKTLVHRLYKY